MKSHRRENNVSHSGREKIRIYLRTGEWSPKRAAQDAFRKAGDVARLVKIDRTNRLLLESQVIPDA